MQLNLDKSVGSQKSSQAHDSSSYAKKTLITLSRSNMTGMEALLQRLLPAKQLPLTYFFRPTGFSRLKLNLIWLFCMTCSSVLHADYDAADLQKLFTDKKQRDRIDATRSGDFTASDIRQQTSKIKVSGYVTRSDGKSVAWINNKNTLDSTRIGEVKVHQSSIGENKKITVSVGGKRKQLKPGEIWHKETGKVVENY